MSEPNQDGYVRDEQPRLGVFARGLISAANSPLGRRLLTRAIQTASKIPYFSNRMGSWNWFLRFTGGMPQTDRDYTDWANRLGDVRRSSIWQAGRRWLAMRLPSARLKLVSLDSDNQETEITRGTLAEVLDLLARPNPYCTWSQFMAAFAASWISPKATVYVRKRRDESAPGKPVIELWPEPNWKVRPVIKPNPGGVFDEFLSGYEVERNGIWYPVAPMDMLVWRDGFDPETREGENWLGAIIAELFADKAVGAHIGRTVSNGLISKLIVGLGDKKNPATPAQVLAFQEKVDRDIRNGVSNVLTVSGNVSSAKMEMDVSVDALIKLRQTPEQRFAAAMGVSVISLKLGAGVEVSTYSNVDKYIETDYRDYVVPLHTLIAEVLTQDLLTEFGQIKLANGKRFQLVFDYSQVPEMLRDKSADAEWVTKLWEAGLLTQAEAREQMGYRGGEKKYFAATANGSDGSSSGEATGAPGGSPIGDGIPSGSVN